MQSRWFRQIGRALTCVAFLCLDTLAQSPDTATLAPIVNAIGVEPIPAEVPTERTSWQAIKKQLINDQSVNNVQFGLPDDDFNSPVNDDGGPVELGTGPVPNVQGDFFDGGSRRVIFTNGINHAFHTSGLIMNGLPGAPDSFIAFERDGTGFADDFTTAGMGFDSNGDGHIDTFPITEPLPPNEVPTSPGPGFVFQGGTAVFTGTNNRTTPPNAEYVDGGIWFASYDFRQDPLTVAIPAGGGLAVRRVKIAENNSPLPRNRVFTNFNFFNDVRGGYGDVSRYTMGYEMLAPGGLHSLEVRVPVAGTLATDQSLATPGVDGFEWGNVVLTLKGLLYFDDSMAFSAGAGVALPTAGDASLTFFDGSPLLSIDNESVHLLPFLAGMRAKGNYFVQGFMQLDLDLNGNTVQTAVPGTALSRAGKLQDSSLFFLDVAAGFWLHRNPHATITSVAALAELHYATTMQDADTVEGNGIRVTDLTNRFDVLDLTLGTTTEINNNLDLATGFVLPLRTGNDRVFDYEFLFQVNRRF